MNLPISICLALLAAVATVANAQPVTTFHSVPGVSKPTYSEAVEVRGAGVATLYVSSLVPDVADASAPKDSRNYFGDTQVQTDGILRRLKTLLERRGYTMKDVVKVNVYLVGDPTKGGATDGDGFSVAYAKHFGTAETPTLPARTRIASAALTNSLWLVAIEAIAAKSEK